MRSIVKAFILHVLAMALLSPLFATEGWELPPRTIKYPDKEKAWIVPVENGAQAFDVIRRNGAEGTVKFVDGSIRICKTNDKGAIWVFPKIPVLMSSRIRRFRVSAEVESTTKFLGLAKGYVRIGYHNEKGLLGYSIAADNHASSGSKDKMDLIVCTPKGRPQLKAAHFNRQKGDTNEIRVAIVVAGAHSETVWRNFRVDSLLEIERMNGRARRGCHGRDFSPDLTEASAFEAWLARDVDHTAQVIKEDGYAKLKVDGVTVPPILFKGGHAVTKHLQFGGARMHEAGVPLLVPIVRLGSTANTEGAWTTNGFDAVKAVNILRRSMLTAPDALYVVTIVLDAPKGWCDIHTNEIWRTESGEEIYGNGDHVVGTASNRRHPSWRWASYHSQVWRDEAKSVLAQFIAELKRSGISKRIVGVHLGGGHDRQFATARPDWSKPARRAFAASGETDYVRFLKRAPMEIQDDFAQHVRACFGKQIVVFRWCMAAFGSGFCSSHDICEFADSKELDVIVPQPSYLYRSPGYAVGVKVPFSSLHLNGKMLMHELDLRTYASWPNSDTVVRDAGHSRAEDIDEWRVINRKMAGQMIARRTGFWYFDMGSGWFDFPEIAEDISSVIEASKAVYLNKCSLWHPTAAFVIDTEDLVGLQRASGMCEKAKADINRYIEAIAASGVPFDVYMKADFERHPEIANRYSYVVHYNRGTPHRTAAQLNVEATAAGAYVPLPPNVVQVDMNGDFLSVHCIVPGRYDFTLPRKCRVVNVKSNQEEILNGINLPLELTAGQTSWFILK